MYMDGLGASLIIGHMEVADRKRIATDLCSWGCEDMGCKDSYKVQN